MASKKIGFPPKIDTTPKVDTSQKFQLPKGSSAAPGSQAAAVQVRDALQASPAGPTNQAKQKGLDDLFSNALPKGQNAQQSAKALTSSLELSVPESRPGSGGQLTSEQSSLLTRAAASATNPSARGAIERFDDNISFLNSSDTHKDTQKVGNATAEALTAATAIDPSGNLGKGIYAVGYAKYCDTFNEKQYGGLANALKLDFLGEGVHQPQEVIRPVAEFDKTLNKGFSAMSPPVELPARDARTLQANVNSERKAVNNAVTQKTSALLRKAGEDVFTGLGGFPATLAKWSIKLANNPKNPLGAINPLGKVIDKAIDNGLKAASTDKIDPWEYPGAISHPSPVARNLFPANVVATPGPAAAAAAAPAPAAGAPVVAIDTDHLG